MYFDTHTHLYLPEFGENLEEKSAAVNRALDAGVSMMIFPNVDCGTVAPLNALANIFPQNIRKAMGLHPTEIKEDWSDRLVEIIELIDQPNDYVSIGEVGIDLYWDKTFADQQMQALDAQVSKAAEKNLPLILHCREGLDQTLEVLSGHKSVEAVFHSFGGTEKDVDHVRRVGDFYFGINGVVTFKNANLGPAIEEISINRLLLETDSPYLTPVPYRGKRNESAYLPYISNKIADLLNVEIDFVAQQTYKNAEKLFKL